MADHDAGIVAGAPFWFDTLNKFMVVRSTVKPKEKSNTEGSKDLVACRTYPSGIASFELQACKD